MSAPTPAVQVFFSSRSNEWYTPTNIVEAARLVLGGIDLDPASCAKANEVVRADRYYSPERGEDGFRLPWSGQVFLNPPYGPGPVTSSSQGDWSHSLIEHYEAGAVEAAVLVVNAVPEAKWFHPLRNHPLVVTRKPVKFVPGSGETKGGAKKATAIVYLGTKVKLFREAFEPFGFYWPPVTKLQFRHGAGGRPRKADEEVVAEIRHVLSTGEPWRDHRTAYRRWQEWSADGTLAERLAAAHG